MKHFKLFDNTAEYQTFVEGGYVLPYLSVIKDIGNKQMGVVIKPTIKAYDIVGSLCLFDSQTGRYVYVYSEKINSQTYPLTRYTPIGIVVIPKFHDLYGTNELALISLVNMNPNNPDSGGGSIGIPFGNTAATTLTNYNQVGTIPSSLTSNEYTGSRGFGYIPTNNIYDYFENDVLNGTLLKPQPGYGLDTKTWYSSMTGGADLGPSPYLEDGSRNIMYNTNKSSIGLNYNCLSDIKGTSNNKTIINLCKGQSNWKTATTIETKTTSGYFPAVCCAYRYHTNGTKQGDWFIPSAGEIGYLLSRVMEIQSTLNKVIEVYGENYVTPLNMGGSYWVSTFHSSANCRYVYLGIGGMGHQVKTTANLVRTFIKIK